MVHCLFLLDDGCLGIVFRKLIKRANFEFTRLSLRKFCEPMQPASTVISPTGHQKKLFRLIERLALESNEKLLILTDTFQVSPGGYSALSSLSNALSAVGAEVLLCTRLEARDIEEFQPTVIIASDTKHHLAELKKFNDILGKFRCKIGLSLVTDVDDPNVSVEEKLDLYKNYKISFLWGFKDERFYAESSYVSTLRSNFNVPLISLPFGADVFNYYPIIKRRLNCELDFTFFASRNLDKWDVLKPVLCELKSNGFKGLINGPGWNAAHKNILKHEHMQYLSSSRNGLNVHIPMSRTGLTELNERFYNLMLSGIPQVVDDLPILAPLCVVDKVKVFTNLEQLITILQPHGIADIDDRDRAVVAYEFVMEKHTILHRANHLLAQLRLIKED